MATEKDKIREAWEALKAEDRSRAIAFGFVKKSALAVPQGEEKSPKICYEKVVKGIAGHDGIAGPTSKFYLMDEAGQWPLKEGTIPIDKDGNVDWANSPAWMSDPKRLPSVDTSTNARRSGPKPLPRWVIALAVAAFLGACYIVLKYFSLG